MDGESRTPLTGASIYLDHTTVGTTSIDSGKFVLNGIPSGNYTLIISYVGYNSVSVPVTADYHPSFTVALHKREHALKEVVVTAEAHWKEYLSLFKLAFNNSLYITYRKKRIYADIWGYGKAYRKPTFRTSILTMLVPETFVDRYGDLADPGAVISEGYWATLRVADHLPFDYTPEKRKATK